MTTRVLLIEAIGRWTTQDSELEYEQVVLPLGLMYLSSFVKREIDSSLNVRILNVLTDISPGVGLRGVIEDFDPHVVGVRGLTLFEGIFDDVLAVAKEVDASILTVAGGPLPTTEPDRIAAKPNVDICVLGEGEVTFAEVLQAFLAGKSIIGIPGTIGRSQSGDLIRGLARPLIADLDALPLPDYELIDLAHYESFLNYGYNRRRQGVILTSRGCPYQCIFCHVNLGKEFRKRSPQSIFDEIRQLHRRYGIGDFFIVDDIFNFDYQRSMDFFDLIIESDLDVNMYLVNGIRGDRTDERFLDRMREAGVIWVSYAIESADPAMQKLIKKHLNLENVRRTIEQSFERGFIVNYSFILGFPTETAEQAWTTIHFIKTLPPSMLPFCFGAKYYPGTEMFEMAQKLGLEEQDLRRAMTEPYHGPARGGASDMSDEELGQIYQHYLRRVFLPGIPRAMQNLRRHFSEQEMLEAYGALFHRQFSSATEVLELCPGGVPAA